MKYLKVGKFRIGFWCVADRGLRDILVYLHWGKRFSSWRVVNGLPWLMRKGEAPTSSRWLVRLFQTHALR